MTRSQGLLAIVVIRGLDYLTTVVGLNRGLFEVNPLAVLLMDLMGGFGLFALTVVTTTLLVALTIRARDAWPLGVLIVVGLSTVAVVNNIYHLAMFA